MQPPHLVCPSCSTKIKANNVPPGHHVRCPGCRAVFNPKEQLDGASSARTDELVGRQLGNYRIVRRIGQGGMGTVYEAVQGGLERRVALKVLSQKLCHDQPFILRFQQEARAAACLDHPNIVQVYEISQDRGRLFFSMQYVEGESLLARVKQNGPLPLEEALDILVQVVYALDYAFQRGIIHRDVKPDNILLTKDGTVKVADLGLAKSLFEPVGLTATGAGLGSPHYMAPEQGRGEKDLGCQADIYSLGITFFVTLTGMRPYGGKSPLDVMMAHIRNPLPSACRYRPELPTEVDEVIGRMAAKAREHRYPDYQSLLADLEMLRRKAHPSRGIRNPFSPVVSGFRRTCARIPVPALVVTIAVCLLCIGFLMARKPLRPWGRSARSDAEPSSASTTNGPVSVLGSGGEHSDSSTFSELVQPNGHVRRDGADTAPPASFGTARKDNPLVLEPLPLKPQSASGDERGDEEPSDGSSGPSDTFVDPTSAGAQGATRMRNSGERARSTQGRPSPGVESVHAQLSGGPGAPSIGLLPQIEPVGGKSRGSAPKKRREPQELPANHEMVFAGKAFRFGVPLPLAGTMEFDIRCPRRATGERYTVFSLDGRPGFAVGIEKHGALFASRLVPGSSQEISVGRQIRTVADGQWHKVRIEYGQGAEKAAVDRSGDSERSLPFLSTGEYGHLVFNPGREMAEISVRNFQVEPWFPKKKAEVLALVDQGRFRKAREECRWLLEYARDDEVRTFAETLLQERVLPRLVDVDRALGHGRSADSSKVQAGMAEVPAGGPLDAKEGEDLPTFYIDECEVSIKDYAEFVTYIRGTGDHGKCHPAEPPGKDHTPLGLGPSTSTHLLLPVHGVDWFDAYAYAAWRGKRLPERAEWEKAAGALQGNLYPWGKTFQSANVNLSDRFVAVDDYLSGHSPYGCYQMAGNVEEWCADRVDQDGRTLRPVCGGSCQSPRAGILIQAGELREATSRELTFGFRCARDPE